MDKENVLTLRSQMLKHFYDYEVTCMRVSTVCMGIGNQSDSIVTTQHSNAWLCEHACIYAIGVQTMLAPNNLIVVNYAPKMANKNNCCDVLNNYRYSCPYYLPMPLFILKKILVRRPPDLPDRFRRR